MSFEIIVPAGVTVGFNIVVGAGGPALGGLISFLFPSVPIGTHLLALVVRNQAVAPASAGWTKVIDGLGAGGRFLDGYIHEVDRSDANLTEDDVREIVFASVDEQELQGYLIAFDNTSASVLVEDSATAAFAATAAPAAPSVESQQAINTIVCIWSAGGVIDFTAPAGFTALDEYDSSASEARTFLIARKTANATGVIAAVAAAAAPNATGRAWTLVLRNHPPLTPPELFDPVPGHIGLI